MERYIVRSVLACLYFGALSILGKTRSFVRIDIDKIYKHRADFFVRGSTNVSDDYGDEWQCSKGGPLNKKIEEPDCNDGVELGKTRVSKIVFEAAELLVRIQ